MNKKEKLDPVKAAIELKKILGKCGIPLATREETSIHKRNSERILKNLNKRKNRSPEE